MEDQDERDRSRGRGQTRIVVDLETDEGTVAGTVATRRGTRPFWGWLELMSELERTVADDDPEAMAAGETGAADRPSTKGEQA